LAFRSGLSSISIAEALITRLRDLEFENLNSRNNSQFQNLDNFVDAVRKATFEMQNSGIPDIILEMTLLKLAAPQTISAPSKVQNINIPAAAPKGFTGNFDEDKKIFYNVIERLPKSAYMAVKDASFKSFNNGVLTLGFSKKYFAIFDNKELENYLAQEFGKKITVEKVPDENAQFDKVKESDRKFLQDSMNIFNTESFTKIESEE
jgi:DNA polymerase III gamma/tau subunit